MRWIKDQLRAAADDALDEALGDPIGPMARYRNTYNVLTITFAEGSEPRSISIPYQPFGSNTDLTLPYRLLPLEGLR